MPDTAAAARPHRAQVANDITQPRLAAHVDTLARAPRPSGSRAYLAAAEHVAATARAAGLDVRVETGRPFGNQPARAGERVLHNVVAERRGTAPDGQRQLVIVGAHLDSVSGGPGANDNASGAAALLELGRLLGQVPARHDVRLVWFDGEEDGSRGSALHVRNLGPDRERLVAMLNVDMVASPRGAVGYSLGARTPAAFGDAVRGAAQELGITATDRRERTARSDHASFEQKGVPVVSFGPSIKRVFGEDPAYHSRSDTQVNAQLLEQFAELVATTTYRLANGEAGPGATAAATTTQ